MTDVRKFSEYLVISRGTWDENLPPEEIQKAIDRFYDWHGRLVAAGKARPGQRLAQAAKLVSKDGVIDGPFAETKEVIGGYWFFLACDLEEAAALAAQNPCVACGLSFEVRPTEEERCSAYAQTNETPIQRRAVS